MLPPVIFKRKSSGNSFSHSNPFTWYAVTFTTAPSLFFPVRMISLLIFHSSPFITVFALLSKRLFSLLYRVLIGLYMKHPLRFSKLFFQYFYIVSQLFIFLHRFSNFVNSIFYGSIIFFADHISYCCQR